MGTDQPGSAAKKPGFRRDRIGVAVSGAGSRSALFGLGSLLFLKDAGLADRVVSMSSVSGGSLLNAHSHIPKLELLRRLRRRIRQACGAAGCGTHGDAGRPARHHGGRDRRPGVHGCDRRRWVAG